MWGPSGYKRDPETKSLCHHVTRRGEGHMCWLFSYHLSTPNPPFNTQLGNAENRTLETIFLFCQLPFLLLRIRALEGEIAFPSQHWPSIGPPPQQEQVVTPTSFFWQSQKYPSEVPAVLPLQRWSRAPTLLQALSSPSPIDGCCFLQLLSLCYSSVPLLLVQPSNTYITHSLY